MIQAWRVTLPFPQSYPSFRDTSIRLSRSRFLTQSPPFHSVNCVPTYSLAVRFGLQFSCRKRCVFVIPRHLSTLFHPAFEPRFPLGLGPEVRLIPVVELDFPIWGAFVTHVHWRSLWSSSRTFLASLTPRPRRNLFVHGRLSFLTAHTPKPVKSLSARVDKVLDPAPNCAVSLS